MTTPKKTASKKAPTRINPDDLDIGEVRSAPGAFNHGLPGDHPLTQAFDKSVEEQGPVHVDTGTPELAKALLRRLAKSRGLGLDSKIDSAGITFAVRPLRPRSPNKSTVETAVDPEL